MDLTSEDSNRAKEPSVLHSGGFLKHLYFLLSKRSRHKYQISSSSQKLDFISFYV